MKNINRDYLVTVNAKTAEIKAPSDMKFFMTDELTCNIFFQLVFESSNDLMVNTYAPKQKANFYYLTLRVVKPNNEPKTIQATPLDEHYTMFVADLPTDFVNIPGIYECELFIDTKIVDKNDVVRLERSTTDSFEYEVKESVFYNLDDIVDYEYISVENIATKEYVEGLVAGNVSLDGYATQLQLASKADFNHTHDQYATKTQLSDAIASVDCSHINLVDFVASNSISINRSEYSVIGDCSTAEGDNTAATGYASHSEGYNTVASESFSHAEGNGSKALNYSAHAEGHKTRATQEAAHSEGYCTEANGAYSHSEGYNTVANGRYQHVQGKFNISDYEVYAHIVGNGIDSENRSNAHTLDWDGNAWFAGNVYVGFNNKILATKEYVDYVVAKGEGNTGDDLIVPTYDDTELRNKINELTEGVTELTEDITELGNSINTKADKRVVTGIYDRVTSINFAELGLDDESTSNIRDIKVINPYPELKIELPEDANVDFAEIHAFVVPIDNEVEISIEMGGDANNLKCQNKDMMPTILKTIKVYEYIFTYINCGGSGRWLVGVITYE